MSEPAAVLKAPLRVLVVEDETDIREVIAQSLEEEGYHVRQAANGHAAFEILAGRDVDVVLCDINMPLCDGVTLLKRTRALLGLRIPFAFLTADASQQVSDLLLLKTQAIFSKPFELDAVMAWLETVAYDAATPSTETAARGLASSLRESVFLTLESMSGTKVPRPVHVVRLEAVSDRELRVSSPPKAIALGELFSVRARPPFEVRVNRMSDREDGRGKVRELWLGVVDAQPQATDVLDELKAGLQRP